MIRIPRKRPLNNRGPDRDETAQEALARQTPTVDHTALINAARKSVDIHIPPPSLALIIPPPL